MNRWAFAVAWLLFSGPAFDLPAASGNVPRARAGALKIWGTEDGLPQSSVIAMTQTRDGYLWLGTLNGLVRFDGTEFTVFDEDTAPGLNSGRIISLFEDSRGVLWIGTESAGIAWLKDGQFTSTGLGGAGAEGRMVAVCEDVTGAVWFCTADGQLWRWREGATNVFNFGASRFSVDAVGTSRAVIAEKSGLVWVGTNGGLAAIRPKAILAPGEGPQVERSVEARGLDFLLASGAGGFWMLADGRVQKRTTTGATNDLGPYPWNRQATRVAAACEDAQGNLVIGTLGEGLFRFDAHGKVTTLSTNDGLSDNNILSLVVDREGSLWVGTDGGGLNRVKKPVFDTVKESLGLVVQSVGEDREGKLWIGYAVGRIDLWRGELIQRLGQSEGLRNRSIKAILIDRDGRIWVGAWGAGLMQWQNNQFVRMAAAVVTPRILALHQDRAGRLWVGTQEGLVCYHEGKSQLYTRRNGMSSDAVRAIADDADGNVWVGTADGGLNRLRDKQFTAFHKQDGLPSEAVSSLYVDEQGVLWIGTDGGLARLHRGQWFRYTKREGLVSNSVGYLIEDGQGYLWIGSNAGLMRVRKAALNEFALGTARNLGFHVYREADGLPTRECTTGSQPGPCRTRDGRLWFPTVKGLASVDPAQLRPNTNPPAVLIESVWIDDQAQNIDGLRGTNPQMLTVPARKESLAIHFTSLNQSAPERTRFKYWMEGHEPGWTEVKDRAVSYRRLPSGEYRFHVTACNEDGLWNETGSVLSIVVLPPFWRTWWFLTATGLVLLGAVAGVVHYLSTQKLHRQVAQLRQQEAVEKERGRIARDIHDQLGANLTQLSLLGELVEGDKESPGDVEEHARQISQTARETTRALDEIVWTVNPSNDTLEGLINYICKYAQDYLAVAGLRYRLDVPPQLPATPLPPEMRHNVFLASKESVTNVVRHAQAGAVWIRLRLDPGRFTLEIEDDGRGPGDMSSKAHRNGLRNMRRRMEDVGGEFSIGPGPERGTLVRLTAPLAKP